MIPQDLHSFRIDALRKALLADGVQVVYCVAPCIRPMVISAGTMPAALDTPLPYDWRGPGLPRCRPVGDKMLFESIFFGARGSASTLTLIGDDQGEPRLNELIVEHCKLHSMLHESPMNFSAEDSLNQSEKQVLLAAAHGLTAKETAIQMQRNRRCIEHLLAKAKRKLNAQNLTEAVFRAICTHQLSQ